MPGVLDTELDVYAKNRDRLIGASEGKFVLIGGDRIVGVYDSKMDAIAAGYREFGNVPFLVKQIVKVEVPQNLFSLSF